MRRLKRFTLAILLIAAFLSVCFAAVGAQNQEDMFHETLPGYRLINTYNEATNTVTADIYVVGGYGNNGQVGICYDTEYLSLAATVKNELVTDYEELLANKKISLSNFVKAFSCVATSETNKVDKLINEEMGEFFFAWYSSAMAYLDALENDVKILSVTFKVKSGYSAYDLKKSKIGVITLAENTPSDSAVRGYSSGAYCANEYNTALRNSGKGIYSLAIYTEYRGIDLEDYSNCDFKDNKFGIKLVTCPDGTKALTGINKSAQVKVLKSIFFLHSSTSVEIYDRDGTTPAQSISQGSVVKITGEDATQEIKIVFCDVSSDGITDMYDLNLLMQLARGDIDKDAGISIYTIDSDANGRLSASEYFEFLDLIVKNTQGQ